jgi:hypothetical protein
MARTTNSASHSAEPMSAFGHGAPADYWMRTMGVPWEQLSRAVKAVSDRAAVSMRRQFEDLQTPDDTPTQSPRQ